MSRAKKMEEWKAQTRRVAAKLHPLTIEQNAVTSFKSRTTLVPARANTIGLGLFLKADYAIGGTFGRTCDRAGAAPAEAISRSRRAP
jgi:hypothetical protein